MCVCIFQLLELKQVILLQSQRTTTTSLPITKEKYARQSSAPSPRNTDSWIYFDFLFPTKIVGVLLTSYGLSAAIVTQVYKSFFYPSVTRYFFFLSIFLAAMTVPGMLFLRQLPKEDADTKKDANQSAKSIPRVDEDSEEAGEKKPLVVSKYPTSPEQIDTLYPEYEGFGIFKHLDFYLIGTLTFLGSGAGYLFINTLGAPFLLLGPR